MHTTQQNAVLLLADGTIFHGKSIGISGKTIGEICFNTGMTGYQEIFTDPSYSGQIIVTATAHIGNYGITPQETESSQIHISGLVCKNFSATHSRPAATGNLFDYFKTQNIVGISDVDTRALVSYIRDFGAQNAIISTDGTPVAELKEILQNAPSMKGLELASKVSTQELYVVGNQNAPYTIAALDLGIKQNIIKCFTERNCKVYVFPYNTPFETLQAINPNGYFLSNGPGDPEPLTQVQETAKQMIHSGKPVFGICLGHQILALANGISTYKMFNGHRGINHPVMNIVTGKGEITSQNHGFAVNREQRDTNTEVELTHYHLNDNTVAGMRMKNKPVFSVQYHPESSPGPHDSRYLFDEFITLF